MIATGEASGSLEQACFAVSKQLKRELRYLTKNLGTLIEPILTGMLAVIVLFVALAVFLPMWDLVKVVRG
jgi:MSHA biogenesis protein MshG